MGQSQHNVVLDSKVTNYVNPKAALHVSTQAQSPVQQYQVEVVSEFEQLLRLQSSWDELVEQAGIDHPYLRHNWICTWWECFGRENSLYVVLVKDGIKLVGIAPLMLSKERQSGLSVRCLSLLYNPHTPRCDFIVAPGAEKVYRRIWEHLHSVNDEWDVLKLPQMLADSNTLKEFSSHAKSEGYLFGSWQGEKSPYLPFNGTWENYCSQLNRKHRSNIRNRLKRLNWVGAVQLEVIDAGHQLGGAINEGLRIEAAAWKSNTRTAINCNRDVERFYRLFAERASSSGVLRLIFLTVGGVRIAFAYGLEYRNKLYVQKTGYDPDYARYSPYNLLCYMVFEDGFSRGIQEYEFLGSNDAWKLEWTSAVRAHEWLFVYAPRWSLRVIHSVKFQWLPRLRGQPVFRYVFKSVRGWKQGLQRKLAVMSQARS